MHGFSSREYTNFEIGAFHFSPRAFNGCAARQPVLTRQAIYNPRLT
jgi:hypothetical protein